MYENNYGIFLCILVLENCIGELQCVKQYEYVVGMRLNIVWIFLSIFQFKEY